MGQRRLDPKEPEIVLLGHQIHLGRSIGDLDRVAAAMPGRSLLPSIQLVKSSPITDQGLTDLWTPDNRSGAMCATSSGENCHSASNLSVPACVPTNGQ
jgi:hypothetical protein